MNSDMNTKKSVPFIKKIVTQIDWKLLLFLVLFLDVKLAVKVAAIVIIYLLQQDFKFGFKLKNSRLPLFYLLIIAIAFINWIIYKGFTNLNYSIAFFTGIGYWLLCILAIHQLKLFIEKNNSLTIHNTIAVFFIINAFVSLITFVPIIWEIKELNPYLYQGQYQKYFIGTGDYIRGITFDVSTTNAILNAFGVVYFLVKKNMQMLLLCMIIVLLTGSNFTNLMLLLTFFYLFIFKTDRNQKSIIIVCIMLLIVFMAKISPQNNQYTFETFKNIFTKQQLFKPSEIASTVPITQKPDSLLNPDERKEKIATLYLDSLKGIIQKSNISNINHGYAVKTQAAIEKPVIPGDSIHTATFQSRKDTTVTQKELVSFANTHEDSLTTAQKEFKSTLPGKAIAFKQSVLFFRKHPLKIIAGTGMGNFSSKLAYRITGLKVAGGYPAKFIYINKDFLDNHLNLYLFFFSKNIRYHSLTNNPASVYDQLFCEYGIIGIFVFAIFYFGFFIKHRKHLTYGIPLLILLTCSFAVEYWFEQLSIVVFFELLLLLNIKETSNKTENKNDRK